MKRTIVVLVITLVLAAWVYWMEVREGSRLRDTEEQTQVSKSLVGATSDEIRSFTLARADSAPIEVERFNDEWVLKSPVSADAEESEVKKVLWDLAWTEKQQTIEPSEITDDLVKEYGLDKPRGQIDVTTALGSQKFIIGGANPGGKMVYVRAGVDGPVHLVEKAFADNLDKTLFQMRNKTLVNLVPSQVGLVKLFGATRAELLKEDGAWNLTDPFRDYGDNETINKLLENAVSLKVVDFADDNPTGYSQYGLPDPNSPDVLLKGTYVTIAEGAAGGKLITISFGDEAPPGGDGHKRLYAIVKGQPTVLVVPADKVAALFVRVSDLQSKKPVRMDPYALKRVTISSGLSQVELSKPDMQWQVVKPYEAPADSQAVKALLDAFNNARIEQQVTPEPVLSRYGLEVPRGSFTFVEGSKETRGLIFGGDAPDETVYVRRDDTPGVFRLSKALFDRLATPALDFHTRQMQQISMDNATSITVERADGTFVIEPESGPAGGMDWKLVQPVEAPSDPIVMTKITLALATTTATSLVERDPSDLAAYGLDSPTVKVSVAAPGPPGEEPKALLVGKAAASGDSYCMLEGDGMIFTVGKDLVRNLTAELRDPGVFAFSRAQARRVEFTKGDEYYVAVRSDGEWRAEIPQGHTVDSTGLEDELLHLARMETTRFVRYTTEDLADYGLVKPAEVVRIETPSGAAALSVGAMAPSGYYYATSTTVDGVFLVDPGDIMNVLKPGRLFEKAAPAAPAAPTATGEPAAAGE